MFKINIDASNSFPYTKRCLDSILQQSLQDFKIEISIDESDKSYGICNIYLKRHPREISITKNLTYDMDKYDCVISMNGRSQMANDYLLNIRQRIDSGLTFRTPIEYETGLNIDKNTFLWCVDTSLNANIIMMQSIMSFRAHNKKTKFTVLTTNDNPFMFYLKKLIYLNILFVEDYDIKLFDDAQVIGERLSKCVYFRFIPFSFAEPFNNYNKVMYIDNDTICMENIERLFDLTSNKPLYMATDNDELRTILNSNLRKNGIVYEISNYYNAGVFVIDMNIITFDDYKKMVDSLKYKFDFNDQDIINYVFNDRIYTIDGKYNWFKNADRKTQECSIRHIPGDEKYNTCDLYSKNYIRYVKDENFR